MLTFLTHNLATILVSLGVLALLIWIIVKMRKDKKKGGSCACGSCSGCPSAGQCHKHS